MRRAFTLIELLVVIAIIAILASVILVAVTHAGVEAQRVRTASFLNDAKLGVEKYYNNVHKYPFITDSNGDFNVDDCWRELAPTSNELTAGCQPSQAGYRNTKGVECLSLQPELLAVLGDGKQHVVDPWHKPYSMQWDWFNLDLVIWSAAEDGQYDISDDPQNGGHSILFATKTQAQTNNPPVITPLIQATRFDNDLSTR